MKPEINIVMGFWGVGGAERFWERLSRKLPQYEWLFTTKVDPNASLVIYSNDHKFYKQAKQHSLPTIMRITGPRSYKLPQQDDLKAVICSSKKSYELSKHQHKVLIYNGIDFEHLRTIQPIKCDLLYGPARVGKGQAPEIAIKYALRHSRKLTITGSRQHLAENTYDMLRKKYPQVDWRGLVDEDTMLGLIKGCKEAIMPTSTHGFSNFILECVSMDKPIINLGGVEIPNKADIDINNTVRKYQELVDGILNG